MANDIRQIKVGGSIYDIVATNSDKLGGQEASKYALVANLPTQYAPVDAEKNVQSDWNETNTSSDAYIKNKPTIPTKSSWNYDDVYVKHSASQSLTDAQKIQARTNIGAGTSSFSGNYNDLTNKPDIPTVNNGTLTIQVNGTSKGTFTANQSGNSTVNITAADLGLSGAMRFLGSTTTAIGDGFKTSPITIKVDGVDTSITPAAGNVVLYGGYEYVWTGSAWEQLGQEGSFSLRGHDHEVSLDKDTFVKSILGGSGSLTSNDTSTDGIAYVASASHTAASLGTPDTSSAAPSGHTHPYDKATGVTLTANTSTATGRITYLQDVSHTAASLTGTTTFIATASYTNGILTLTSGTVGISGGSISKTTRYLSAAPTTTSTNSGTNSGTNFNAVTGYPSFSGGSGSHTTKYLHHTHLGASVKTDGQAVTGVTVLADE